MKKNILIVDDEEVIREFLTEVLSDDFNIKTATDGDEAIELLKEQRFDLVITDMKMERVQGEEVVKFTKQKYPDTEVIVISGYSSLYSVSQTVNSGAYAFLSKPFSIKELMGTIENAMSC
ncbi:MAG: response regulator [Calditrichaeota bacterium]|nr:MAG: response regulator [Calditrichota bacterium]